MRTCAPTAVASAVLATRNSRRDTRHFVRTSTSVRRTGAARGERTGSERLAQKGRDSADAASGERRGVATLADGVSLDGA